MSSLWRCIINIKRDILSQNFIEEGICRSFLKGESISKFGARCDKRSFSLSGIERHVRDDLSRTENKIYRFTGKRMEFMVTKKREKYLYLCLSGSKI